MVIPAVLVTVPPILTKQHCQGHRQASLPSKPLLVVTAPIQLLQIRSAKYFNINPTYFKNYKGLSVSNSEAFDLFKRDTIKMMLNRWSNLHLKKEANLVWTKSQMTLCVLYYGNLWVILFPIID